MKLPALVLLAAFAAGWRLLPACGRAAIRRAVARYGRPVRGGAVRSVVPLPHDRQRRPQRGARSHRERQRQLLLRTRRLHGDGRGGRTPFYRTVAADNACDTLYMPDMRYSLSVAAAQAPVDTLTVYTIRRESYTGGAHGMRTTEYHNYWTKGGYELSLGDLFPEEQLPRLTERIKAKLREPSTVPPMTRSSPSGVSFPKRSPRPRISRSRPKGSSSTTTPTTSPAMPSARSTYPLRRRS